MSTTKPFSAKAILTDLTKYKSHQKYLDKDLQRIDLHVHNGGGLNKLRLELEINSSIFTKNVQYETQELNQMIYDFRERMINVAGLINNNTKRYREEIQMIDSQLKKIDSKNVCDLKQLKLEYCALAEDTEALNVVPRNHSSTPHRMARSTTHLSKTVRKVTSAPIEGLNSTYRKSGFGSWASE